jgi:multiple sugar transport system ATP-binding protein
MAELALRGVTKRFGRVTAVDGLNLEMQSGEFVVLLGPSGAGKTTTLRLVAGLETAEAGSVHIGGHDLTRTPTALRDVAFVFQQYSLYPHLTVYENLAFPLRSPLRRTSEAEIQRIVGEVAAMLRIDDKLQNPATRLSGGQMQRVAIGRALVRRPSVYLMDEPLSSLDAKLRNDLRLELKRIQQDLGATMLYVTHDQIEAMTLATRIGVLDHGRLVQVGTPQQIYEEPASAYVASRLGSPRISLLPADLLAGAHAEPRPPGATQVGVRAESTRLHADAQQAGCVPATVQRAEQLSDQHLVHLSLAGAATLICNAHGIGHLEPGRHVGVELTRPLWFDAAGQRIAA